jgi:hypothetical protein
MTPQHSNGNTPDFITALLAPAKGSKGSRRAWGIDVETVWVPFFTATNVDGKTFLDDDILGAPIRLAKTKDGEVRFDQNGRPRMRVAPELNAQVTLVRENFVSGLMAYTGNIIAERPDEYREQVEAAQLAGTAVFEQQAHDVALAVEILRQQEEAQAALEAAAAAQVEQDAAAAEVPTPGRNRSRANAQVESVEAQAS